MVRTFDGRPVRLDDALGIGWAVVGIDVDPRQVLGKDAETWQRVGATFATLHAAGERPQGQVGNDLRAEGLIDLEDVSGALTGWRRRAGVNLGSVLAMLPDKFVFGISDGQTDELTRALVAQLGLEQPTLTEPTRAKAGRHPVTYRPLEHARSCRTWVARAWTMAKRPWSWTSGATAAERDSGSSAAR